MIKADFNTKVHTIIGNAVTPKAAASLTPDGRIIATPSLTINDVDAAIDQLYADVTGTATAPTPAPAPAPATTPPTNSVGSDGDLKDVLNVAVDFSAASVKLPAKPSFTIELSTKNNQSYGSLLVDIEAYNAAGTKVGQAFVQDKAIQAGSTTKVVLAIDGLPAGTYSTKVLIFNQPVAGSYDWGTKRYGTENAGSFQLAPADQYVSSAANSSGYYRAPQTVDQYAASDPVYRAIADQPQGVWLGNEWIADPQATGAKLATDAAGQRLLLVIYSIPGRDAGQYSAGGLSGPAAYKAWIDKLALGVDTGPATYVIEPDALGLISGLDTTKRAERIDMLKYAVQKLKSGNPSAKVYMDASTWVQPEQMAILLAEVNPGGTTPLDGFSCNVSGYNATPEVTSWGNQVSQFGQGLHYIIDTSRNGKGGTGEWCNPPGRGLGKKPTTSTGIANVDAFLWIKAPGESDGTCNGGPSAGAFWPERAKELIANAVF